MVAHGGIDALIWLCRTSTNTEIHHLITTNLAILAEKESIRPVIITKWALPPLLQLLQYYMHCDRNMNDTKLPPTASISSSSLPSNSDTHSSAPIPIKQSSIDDINLYTIHLEIIINCTHVLYQLARAGILSQEEIITDGILDILFSLTLYEIKDIPIKGMDKNEENNLSEKLQQQQLDDLEHGVTTQEQWKERGFIIQSLAAKSISFVSATVSNQPSMIEQLRNTNNLALALVSDNDEVKKYIAKTVAYLSLRNDKYKPVLLGGDKVRALLSILVVLPQLDSGLDDMKDTRKSDLDYYLYSWHEQKGSKRYDTTFGSLDHAPYTAAVSHVCCALANFATNNESQLILMAQPRLVRYICNIPSSFPSHMEIHRHVARCLANLALYDENKDKMLAMEEGEQNQINDSFNVIPTLLAMGQSANVTDDIRRHIIRALDNLSSNVVDEASDSKKAQFWKTTFQEIQPFIEKIMTVTDEADTLKRAKLILQRGKDIISETPNGSNSEEDEQAEQHENGMSKTKSKKKNKKKKKN
ncbi:armadillo-type protein [Halteromyces radiatus]|uniref:armadillo-type protein n=1 Tax=Halteromyces radiatus TaxID=101107 RepID=UPI00221E7A3B|nr:armadillo-type protein [Halteromyces radiatus]KAI8086610.1 armadillo-type protein [Halteromyces radiatus]